MRAEKSSAGAGGGDTGAAATGAASGVGAMFGAGVSGSTGVVVATAGRGGMIGRGGLARASTGDFGCAVGGGLRNGTGFGFGAGGFCFTTGGVIGCGALASASGATKVIALSLPAEGVCITNGSRAISIQMPSTCSSTASVRPMLREMRGRGMSSADSGCGCDRPDAGAKEKAWINASL